MFNKIGLISIPVKDQQTAKVFYTEVLGFKVVIDMPFGPNPDTRWLMLEYPGVETRIVLVTWFPQMPAGSVQGIVIHTTDIAKAHAELKQRGLKISEINKQSYGQEATFSDPDGNGWVLQQPASVA